MPSAERNRAGFVLGERVGVGMYGETYRASGSGRNDLEALVVDASVAGAMGVEVVLLDEVVPALRPVHHRAIVGTVGAVRDAGELIVITEPVPAHVTLHELLTAARTRGVRLPQEIAAAVARAVVDAVATAHAADAVHGAIHPRSVLIDVQGNVWLADFAIGCAVTYAVWRGAPPDLIKGLAGYLAPEVAVGEEPTPASDVFALGAMIFAMLTGELPPGSLNTSPAVERLVQRALDSELARRFTSAVELQENFAEALEDDRWYTATTAELARFVAKHRAGGDAVDAATEDLLASLAAASDPPTRSTLDAAAMHDSARDVIDNASGGLDALIDDLDASLNAPHAEDDGDEPLTEVDGARQALERKRDPISEMLEIERVRTGSEVVVEPALPERKSGERARRIGRATAANQAAAAIDSLGLDADAADAAGADGADGDLDDSEAIEVVAPPRAVAARREPVAPRASVAVPAPAPEPELDALMSLGGSKSKLSGLVWLVVILAAGAALVWVITDLRDKNAASARKDEELKAAAAQETERLKALQEDPGTVRVTSTPDLAAVWLLVGRTPTDSFPLPTANVLELRLELDGHAPFDTTVAAKDWAAGAGKVKQATVKATLQAGAPATPVPAMPDEPAAELRRGLSPGYGVVHVETSPPGAAVWLLVGQTNTMQYEGIEAGRDYEFKVVKDGFVPGYVQIKAEEWRSGGDPQLPLAAAPKHALLERAVELVEDPAAAASRDGKRGKSK